VDTNDNIAIIGNPAASSGTITRGVNGAGQLLGWYTDSTGDHGFVATPMPDPTTLGLAGICLTGLGIVARRR
jgi:hypothetical protein